jgi:ligand-binding SRPBCC domain-containing protein
LWNHTRAKELCPTIGLPAIARHMKTFQFECELKLARPIGEVFAFFSDASNLELLTPPWVNFRILTPQPIHMAVGTQIQYRLKLRGLPVRWESRISVWDPPHRFVDDQLRGPYRLWHHEHLFEERNGATLVKDQVTYAVLGGAILNALVVAPDVRKIFAFRQQKLRELFP